MEAEMPTDAIVLTEKHLRGEEKARILTELRLGACGLLREVKTGEDVIISTKLRRYNLGPAEQVLDVTLEVLGNLLLPDDPDRVYRVTTAFTREALRRLTGEPHVDVLLAEVSLEDDLDALMLGAF